MVVRHNMQAMNSNRMLNVTQSSLSKTTEKLSSGYRINRAADDAAGLAISEKMRKQIKGLNQASSNAQDGISCVQTAEGALGEVQDMLQRMNQLAVQASNGTNSKEDRQNIQDEIDQLVTEIDRISETTKFNETYLLKGATDGETQALGQYTYKEYTATKVAWSAGAISAAVVDFDRADLGVSAAQSDATSVFVKQADGTYKDLSSMTVTDFVEYDDDGNVSWKEGTKLYLSTGTSGHWAAATDGATSFQMTEIDISKLDLDRMTDIEYTTADGTKVAESSMPVNGVELADNADNKYFILNEDGSRKYLTDGNVDDYMNLDMGAGIATFKDEYVGKIMYVDASNNIIAETNASNVAVAEKGVATLYDADGNRLSANALADIMKSSEPTSKIFFETGQSFKSVGLTNNDITNYIDTTQVEYKDALELTFHVGSESDANNKISIDIETINSVNLGVDILSSKKNGIVDDDGQSATDAIEVIASAINKVSSQRSSLGAIQNRLEHTINNLDNIAENTTAAESAIRDTDMATTMVEYSNANILAQAGQSMLAQANQANQGVLSLLG